ncbi:unnamed protein product [Clonostachys rhizophaga]|uniref:Uncharacterized protein n=1 Tax=Clonostachys rhizophaga TaxID=160324 RepID=A0A9N9W5Y4_9HYPO|nr:unnamed protein product [Clonostachys rhizophaga]
MHFVKTAISLFALASFTSGQYVHPTVALAVRETEEYRNYIAARDGFIGARDDFKETRDLSSRKFKGRTCLQFSGKYKCFLSSADIICGCSKEKFNKACSC